MGKSNHVKQFMHLRNSWRKPNHLNGEIMKNFFNNITSNFHYRYALILPILYALIYGFISSRAQYTIRNTSAFYLVFQENFFSISALGLIILNFVFFAFYRTKITRGNESFKIFNLNKNTIAKKLTIKFTTIVTVLSLISTTLSCLSFYSRYEADDKALKQYTLFSEDVTLCNYDEVEEINVYLEWENRGKHDHGYATIIELKTAEDTYKLSSYGFDDDYYVIKKFLLMFNKDIITVDNTYSDETDGEYFYGYTDHPEIFEEIYK